jgi:ribose-phosphate pyrophosphokinase
VKTRPLLFSTCAYEDMAREMLAGLGATPGSLDRRTFPDGERYLRLRTAVSGQDVVLVGGAVSDADTLELCDLAAGFVQEGAQSLTLVLPYFAYSTMERAAKAGEIVTAKSRARLISTLPRARSGNRVLLLEVHTDGLPYYFEHDTAAAAVSADPVLLAAARREGGDDFVLASADAGRAKRVQTLANLLGVPAGLVLKKRIDDRRTELVAMSADVAGRHVVVYDDMIRTGSSLLSAARAYRDSGAREVTALATHGVFPEDALDRLRDSGLLRRVVCTDSHPRARELQDGDFLVVDPVAGLLVDALRAMP